MPNPAAVAYEAYRSSLNTAAVQSQYLTPWHCLSKAEQTAWWAVIRAIVELNNPKPKENEDVIR